jgi:hypothetical protein
MNDILPLKFYVTKLDSSTAFVFGHNWLHRYNPSIDWSAGQITYFRRLLHSVPSSARTGNNVPKGPPAARNTSASDPKPSVSSDTSAFDDFIPSSNSSSSSSTSEVPSVSFITLPLMHSWHEFLVTLFLQ